MGVEGLTHYAEVLQQLFHRYLGNEVILPVTIDANANNNIIIGDLLCYQNADNKYMKLIAITNIAAEVIGVQAGATTDWYAIAAHPGIVPGTCAITLTVGAAPVLIDGDNGSGVFGTAHGTAYVDYVTGAIFVHCVVAPDNPSNVTLHYHYTTAGAWNNMPVAIALEAVDATAADGSIPALTSGGHLRESQLNYTFTNFERKALKEKANIIVS